ncbi:unnamed protein product [Coregonus sp. 'balchen']|nr:unnamed protein product [Coregonus sp. 'balchen']
MVRHDHALVPWRRQFAAPGKPTADHRLSPGRLAGALVPRRVSWSRTWSEPARARLILPRPPPSYRSNPCVTHTAEPRQDDHPCNSRVSDPPRSGAPLRSAAAARHATSAYPRPPRSIPEPGAATCHRPCARTLLQLESAVWLRCRPRRRRWRSSTPYPKSAVGRSLSWRRAVTLVPSPMNCPADRARPWRGDLPLQSLELVARLPGAHDGIGGRLFAHIADPSRPRSVPRLPRFHGGDYDAFEGQVCRFFKALKDMGALTTPKKKFENSQKTSSIKDQQPANSLSMELQVSGVLPTLIKHVFKQVLSSLKVPFAQCIWNCPVLTNDSDFYIFDIQSGCLPSPIFTSRKCLETWELYKSIPCKHYTTKSLLQVLPVFAAVAGNDYVKLQKHGRFPQVGKISSMEGRFARFDSLLNWLARFPGGRRRPWTLSQAYLSWNNKQKMDAALQALSPGHRRVPSSPWLPGAVLQRGWDQAPAISQASEGPSRLDSAAVDERCSSLPHGGDVLLLRRSPLTQWEQHFTAIRQVLYGLLRGGRGPEQQSETPVDDVEEYYREGNNLTSTWLKPPCPVLQKQLQLDTLDQVMQLEVFWRPWCVPVHFERVLPHLRLPVAVPCTVEARPSSTRTASPAGPWLLGLVYGELCRQREEPKRLRGFDSERCKEPSPGCSPRLQPMAVLPERSLDLNQLLCLPLAEPQCAWPCSGQCIWPCGTILNPPDAVGLLSPPWVGALGRASPPSLHTRGT